MLSRISLEFLSLRRAIREKRKRERKRISSFLPPLSFLHFSNDRSFSRINPLTLKGIPQLGSSQDEKCVSPALSSGRLIPDGWLNVRENITELEIVGV